MIERTELNPITHPLLEATGIRHGFFTRQGGVSSGVFQGLNTGIGSSDDPAAVTENRRRIAAWFDAMPDDLAACYQVHSSIAHIARGPGYGQRPQGDAIASNTPGVICAVLTADCAPILLADPQTQTIAAIHAGWKGALDGVIESALASMMSLGARASQTVAVVGPCIGPASYEVGTEFELRFSDQDTSSLRFFRDAGSEHKRFFDLPGYVLWRLERAGIGQAAWTGHDTYADEAHFYSNRRAFRRNEGDFGRLMSAIRL
jgi:YfiH family protein